MRKVISKMFYYLHKIQSSFGHKFRRVPYALPTVMFVFRIIARFLPKIIIVHGSKMYTDPHEATFFLAAAFDIQASYEETTPLFEKMIKKGGTVVDLGANVGFYTLLAARLVGDQGKVYAFEADPKTYKLLVRNLELNNYKNTVAVQKAVCDKVGITRFFLSPEPGADTLYKEKNHGKSIDVEMETLDHFFQNTNQSIDVIKMDIEGAEIDAFTGMTNILSRNPNLNIFIEFAPRNIQRAGHTPQQFFDKILSYNFQIIFPDSSQIITSCDKLMKICGSSVAVNLFLTRQPLDSILNNPFLITS